MYQAKNLKTLLRLNNELLKFSQSTTTTTIGNGFLSRNVSTNEKLKTTTAATATSNSISDLSIKIENKKKKENTDLSKLDTKFENAEIAFKSKTTAELLRGWIVFQMCSIGPLVNNQHTIMKLSRKLLGKKLFNLAMKSTIYGHFVAGESQELIKGTIHNMLKYNVKSILDYSVEDDLHSTASSNEIAHESSEHGKKYYHPSEFKFDKNMQVFMDCIDAVSTVTNAAGLAAIKVTSLIRPELLLQLSEFIDEIRKSSPLNVNQLEWNNLTNEKTDYDKLMSLSTKHKFTENEIGEIKNLIVRLDKLIQHAVKKDVRVFVDAEQTYFQVAIRQLTIELMRNFNKKKNIVFNTYQNYLKSAHQDLVEDLELARKENFYFGAKLVRGAYMEQERPRAKEFGYEDPINPTFEATTEMYEKNLLLCMKEIKSRPMGMLAIMVASHNEDTIKFAVEKMNEFDIKASDRVICFGQLLGMCDYISFSLGAAGYSVYKYTPYGPVEEVLPYLSRRAVENRGIFDKVKKEKRLISSEIKRRLLNIQP